MIDQLLTVRKPLQYLNGEINTVRKPFEEAAFRLALIFPDLYELGMSHLGIKILYEVVNGREEMLAERAFAPWLDREARLRESGEPLTSLESGRPLHEFDLLGFTLPYELTCTNILNILDLSRVPLWARERSDSDPFVAGGGPGAFNPEPLADFFDFFLLGDGEEAIVEIGRLIGDARTAGAPREETLRALSRVGGVYVPRFYEPRYGDDGILREVRPLLPGLPERIAKRILVDLDGFPYPVKPPVPYLETTHDRITVEIARGCPRRCRFCQAGTIYRPYRERSPAAVLEMASRALAATGYDEISLSALSCADHRFLHRMLAELMARYAEERISVSLPSLRPGTLTGEILREIRKVKRTGFTIAPEAGSQRLRNVISKGITEEEILQTGERLFSEGWSSLKLYFMVGLPTETGADRDAIVELVGALQRLGRRVARKKPLISASIAGFVPKAQTPFQRVPQLPPGEVRALLAPLRERLRRMGARFKWHHPELSALEGAFARGDRRLSAVLHSAWRRGRRFDGWTEHFEAGPWEAAFAEHGLDLATLIGRPRPEGELLPWEHLTSPAVSAHLAEEERRSREGIPSEPCVPGECPACGLCEDYPEEAPGPALPARPPAGRRYPVRERLRLEFSKSGTLRYLPHLSLFRTFYRAFRRAGIPLDFSRGHTPHPRIQLGPPLPLGYESESEFLDFEINTLVDRRALAESLSRELPPGIEVRSLVKIPLKSRSLFDIVDVQTYRIVLPTSRLPDGEPGQWLLDRLEEADALPLERTRKGKTTVSDLKPLVARAELIGEDEKSIEVLLALRRPGGREARPTDVLRIAGGFPLEEEFHWKITRTANLVAQGDRWLSPASLTTEKSRRKPPISAR